MRLQINLAGLVLAVVVAMLLHGLFGLRYDIGFPVCVLAPYVLGWLVLRLCDVAEAIERTYNRSKYAQKRRDAKFKASVERMRAKRGRP